ncbi:Chromosome partition protein Smc [Novipirellula artificiosorum]|uniref:Chromosome partition protein Smc n=2 Tax=Novipirellula artificiosorum TaxID=2528016 RepID=A0A5C6D996_9BACT|nr:Chromosome partition protein Smc [Novipirellula artificiosorum]
MNRYFPAFAILALGSQFLSADDKITFEDHVKPVFRQHCLSCHNQGEKKGGLALDSYLAVIEGGGSGEVVYDDGDASGSRMWQLINHDDTPVMPPNQDKIPAEQLAVIRSWIEGGILEDSGSKAKAKKKNSLEFVASSGGKPDGPAAMPETVPQQVPVVTDRASAITAIAASPWAPLVAVAGQKQIVLYQIDTGELLGVLPFDEGVAQSLRFSRDGSFLIAGGGTHALQGVTAIYDVKSGQRVATIGDELDVVFDADVNNNMTRVALGGPQKMLRIYDATDGELVFDLKKHTDWIYAIAYSPDGVLVASGDRSAGLCLWEAETGRLYMDLPEHKAAINAVAWRDDSNVMASASDDGTVKIWDVNTGKAIKSFGAHGGGVTDVAFDHEGRIVTAGKDKRVKLWDQNGNHVRDFVPVSEHVLEAVVSYDGKRVVYGDWSGRVLSALTESPDTTQPLAANPPPAAERAKQVEQQLTLIRKRVAEAQVAWDAATVAVTQAQKPIDVLRSQIAAREAEAAAATATVEAAKKRIEVIEPRLATLTSQTRDSHDLVIAARLKMKDDPTQSELVATAEQTLAEELAELAKLRRERTTVTEQITAQTRLAAMKTTEAATAAESLPAMQQRLEKALQAARQTQAAVEAVTREAGRAEQKLATLTAAN